MAFFVAPLYQRFSNSYVCGKLVKNADSWALFPKILIQKSWVGLKNLLFKQMLLVNLIQVIWGSHFEKHCPEVNYPFPCEFESQNIVFNRIPNVSSEKQVDYHRFSLR